MAIATQSCAARVACGCTRVTVIPSLGVRRSLPDTGDDTIDLGRPPAGGLRYTCGMGMYSGSIKFATEQPKDVS